MKGCIIDIKNPWKRRTVLCVVIVPAVVVYAVKVGSEQLVKIAELAVEDFKQTWKGE